MALEKILTWLENFEFGVAKKSDPLIGKKDCGIVDGVELQATCNIFQRSRRWIGSFYNMNRTDKKEICWE